MPSQSTHTKHVTKEHGDVAKLVVFVSVDRLVILGKGLFKEVAPQTVDFGEALSNQTKELSICLLLGATFHDHRGKLWLLASRQTDLHQLVNGFLRIST